ncbi:MAG TPA: Na+/H+ antiporter NhaA [Pyrinomonadaceae bacterium]|nr:Na+/H+ antiporter NhaA [Pyrinomonadaceae bacterium]
MTQTSASRRLSQPVDLFRDHYLGEPDAQIVLVEYGSYSCKHCHAAHEVIADLRDRFGDRMMYVFRHLPIRGSDHARPAAELAELAGILDDKFWPVHDELMRRGPDFGEGELDEIAVRFGLELSGPEAEQAKERASARVDEDRASARASGARVTPSFFINGRRYEGAWDENALAEAMVGSLGHRIQSAALDFVSWGPSTGLLLLIMSLIAIAAVNSPIGPAFEHFWHLPTGLELGNFSFKLPLLDWINHGLLAIFFLVVGLEIKREFTIGHLATRRSAILPIAASVGGMALPALIFLSLIPTGPLSAGWGVPIATDTAFAIALIVLLGNRVPVELRVFLTAAVIVDDLIAIVVVAIFYSGKISVLFIGLSIIITAALVIINRWNVYRPLPYAVGGILLWLALHEAGLHATLAGVILAVVTPTRPPGNLPALLAQAENVLQDEMRRAGEAVLRHGPSEPALRALDTIHDRIESPADKLLRNLEPWSSYFVLPVFALANAGVALSSDVFAGHSLLMAAIILGLLIGKPIGIVAFAFAAVRFGFADKPRAYNWRQMLGVGCLAGIGFTMSLFIAGQAFPNPADFAAAKIAVFIASIAAGAAGAAILLPKAETEEDLEPDTSRCTAA